MAVSEGGKMEAGSIKKMAVEVISIVIGVMLALGVSEWQEQRDRQEQAEIAVENIEAELRWNLELLSRVHVNNAATVSAMNASDADAESEDELYITPVLQLRDSAHRTLLSSGIANFVSYETILSLSETYSLQTVYKKLGQQLSEAAMNVAAYATVTGATVDNQDFQDQFGSYLEMLVAAEQQLLEAYEATLAELEKTAS
jgi:hypothetical protein